MRVVGVGGVEKREKVGDVICVIDRRGFRWTWRVGGGGLSGASIGIIVPCVQAWTHRPR